MTSQNKERKACTWVLIPTIFPRECNEVVLPTHSISVMSGKGQHQTQTSSSGWLMWWACQPGLDWLVRPCKNQDNCPLCGEAHGISQPLRQRGWPGRREGVMGPGEEWGDSPGVPRGVTASRLGAVPGGDWGVCGGVCVCVRKLREPPLWYSASSALLFSPGRVLTWVVLMGEKKSGCLFTLQQIHPLSFLHTAWQIFQPCSPWREGAGGGGRIQVAAFVLRPPGGPETLQTSFFNRPPKQPLHV